MSYQPFRKGEDLLPAVGYLAVGFVVFGAYFVYQGIVERSALLVTLGAQEQPLRQAQQVKEQVDSLAAATAKLAEQGNQDAKTIIEGMKKQGISIR